MDDAAGLVREEQGRLDRVSAAADAGDPDAADQLWIYLDTLALAQHRTGDHAAAVETQRRALATMPEGADPEVPARLAEYEAALGD